MAYDIYIERKPTIMTIPTIVKPAKAGETTNIAPIAKGALALGLGVAIIGAGISAMTSNPAEAPKWESGASTALMCTFDHASNNAKDVSKMEVTQKEYTNGFRLIWADGVNEVFEGTGNGTEMKVGQDTWNFDGSAHNFTLTDSAGSVINCQ